jgi:hypothetical protein
VNARRLGKDDSALCSTVRLEQIAVRASIVWGEEGNRDQRDNHSFQRRPVDMSGTTKRSGGRVNLT